MSRELKISVGQHSDKGRKETNQDFHGVLIPEEPLLEPEGHRGRAGRRHQQQQRQPDRERIRGQGLPDRLLLHVGILVGEDLGAARHRRRPIPGCTRRRGAASIAYDKDKGYVCTLSAMVIKSTHRAHLSCRRFADLPRLRQRARAADRRSSRRACRRSRAISAARWALIRRSKSTTRRIQIEKGDVFVLATDGVYEHVDARFIAEAISGQRERSRRRGEGHRRARPIEQGSPDNLTVQIVRIDDLPDGEASEMFGQASELPLPPLLEARMVFDGYRIVSGAAWQQPQPHLSRGRHRERRAGRPEDSVDRPARRSRLSEALHDGGVGRPAHQQRPCAEALPAVAQAQLTSTSSPNSSTARR